jgi:hypothetical protein
MLQMAVGDTITLKFTSSTTFTTTASNTRYIQMYVQLLEAPTLT